MKLLLVAILAVAAAGCGLGGSSCETAVREAAEKAAMEDTALQDLDPAIRECATLTDFQRMAGKYPDALDGVDSRGFVSNRCELEPALADSAICGELSE
ncbi:MAG: hypothetical protein M3406_02575 [Chloroflexota bacterium]|nr:hypothetical protein [Chloroflexota bacterium]